MILVAVHPDRASAEAAQEEALSFIPQPERERFAPRLQRRAFWPPQDPMETFREVSNTQMAHAARIPRGM